MRQTKHTYMAVAANGRYACYIRETRNSEWRQIECIANEREAEMFLDNYEDDDFDLAGDRAKEINDTAVDEFAAQDRAVQPPPD